MSGYDDQNNPIVAPTMGKLTITHPQHPYYGQYAEILRSPTATGSRGAFVVRFSDGFCGRVSVIDTDQDPYPSAEQQLAGSGILDLANLRKMTAYLQLLREKNA